MSQLLLCFRFSSLQRFAAVSSNFCSSVEDMRGFALRTLTKRKRSAAKEGSRKPALHSITNDRVKSLIRTPVADMKTRLRAVKRSLCCLTGLNRQMKTHHSSLGPAASEACRRRVINDEERAELIPIYRQECWAKHEALGCDPQSIPALWFWFKDEERIMVELKQQPDWPKLEAGVRFQCQWSTFNYTVEIDADGNNGRQTNLTTKKVRQLVRARDDMVASTDLGESA